MRTCKKRATCHPNSPLLARGLCSSCYSKWLRKQRVPSKCHPNKPEFVLGSGICQSCYLREFRKDKDQATCHPDRPEHIIGSGLCQVCYNKRRISNLPPSKCHPDRPEILKGSGLCQPCYDKQRIANKPRATCHPDRPAHVLETGLCASCSNKKRKYGSIIGVDGKNCDICGDPLRGGIGKSAIDHDHSTGELRGLLCGSCNKLLGFARDRTDILGSAINYLKKHTRVRLVG